jgi:hypothetical protein
MNYSYLHKVTGVVAGSLLSIMLMTILSDTYQLSLAQDSVSNNESITIRKTATSVPGFTHKDHQVVMVTPPIDIGKVWVGKVSWISSEPIEPSGGIEYNQSAIDTDTEHSDIPTFFQYDNRTAALSDRTDLTGATPQTTFGTFDFVVDSLVLHSTNSSGFTVTYALDAVAKDITNTP